MEISYKALIIVYIKGYLLGAPIFLMPGPHMALLVAETIHKGRRSGIKFIVGTTGAIIIMGIILTLGIQNIGNKHFIISLGFVSSVLLLLIGMEGIRKSKYPFNNSDEKKSFESTMWKGFYITIFNPYAVVWTSTIGLKTLWELKQRGQGYVVSFELGFLSALFSIFGTIVYLITKDKFSRIIQKKYKVLVIILSVILIIFSIIFFIESLHKLLKSEGAI
ncbi:MAG: LysE family transporter [bacterium]